MMLMPLRKCLPGAVFAIGRMIIAVD